MFRLRKSEPGPPGQDQIVDRVLCISVTAMLGTVVSDLRAGQMDASRAGQYAAESHRWLRRENLADALTNRERFLIAKALADWSARELIDASSRTEAVGVLLWAISVFDSIPPYDTRCERLPPVVPLLAPTAGFRSGASLRSAEEIASARDLAELWHWRSHATEKGRGGDSAADLVATAAQAAPRAHAEEAMPEPIDGDFAAFGTAYRALDAQQYAEITAITTERHYALNWLSGYASDWDTVPTDVARVPG